VDFFDKASVDDDDNDKQTEAALRKADEASISRRPEHTQHVRIMAA
jgi:hypothetical protein